MAIPDSAPMAVQTNSGGGLQPVKSTAAAAGTKAVIGRRNFIEIPVHAAEAPGGAAEKLCGAKAPVDARNSPHNPQHDPPQGLRGDFPSHSGNFTPPKGPAAGAGAAEAAAGGDVAAGGARNAPGGAAQKVGGAKAPADARNSPHKPQHDPPRDLRGDFPSHSGKFTPPKSPATGSAGEATGGDVAAGSTPNARQQRNKTARIVKIRAVFSGG